MEVNKIHLKIFAVLILVLLIIHSGLLSSVFSQSMLLAIVITPVFLESSIRLTGIKMFQLNHEQKKSRLHAILLFSILYFIYSFVIILSYSQDKNHQLLNYYHPIIMVFKVLILFYFLWNVIIANRKARDKRHGLFYAKDVVLSILIIFIYTFDMLLPNWEHFNFNSIFFFSLILIIQIGLSYSPSKFEVISQLGDKESFKILHSRCLILFIFFVHSCTNYNLRRNTRRSKNRQNMVGQWFTLVCFYAIIDCNPSIAIRICHFTQ